MTQDFFALRAHRELEARAKKKTIPTARTPRPVTRPKKEKDGRGPGRPAGADPVERVNVTIPRALHARAQARAKAEGKTFSKAVSDLLARWVEGK